MKTNRKRLKDNTTLATRPTKRSGGPVTAAGKTRIRSNSLTHGLTGQSLLLRDEDPEAFASHEREIIHSLNPVGAIEVQLAKRIAFAFWKLQRADRAEASACKMTFDRATIIALSQWDGGLRKEHVEALSIIPQGPSANRIRRYATHVWREMESAMKLLRQLQEARGARVGVLVMVARSNCQTNSKPDFVEGEVVRPN